MFVKDIAIFGADGFGKEVACLLKTINERQLQPEWIKINKYANKSLFTGF